MTDYEHPTTAEEFLQVWYALAEAGNTTQLEQWERQFPDLAKTAPDMTLTILRELATSNTPGAKEAAAIYARYVFLARRNETTDLLVTLFQNGDPDIQENVLNTIDVITSDTQLNPIEAANLIAAMKTRQPL